MSVTLTDMEHLSPTQKKTMIRIVEAAIELMSEKGFHRVSVQEIGNKAGLCEKTVFRYFPSKTELLTGIIRYRAYAKELKEEFTRACRWELGHDLRLAARLYLQATSAKRNAFRAYLSALESVDTNGDDYLKSAREMLAFLHDYMLRMQQLGRVREGDAELMARTFINTLHGYMLMYCLNDDRKVWQSKVDSLRLTIDLFIQGFERKENEEGKKEV
ncbi:TetR/AcrR family transcriptional regulator [Akkermansia glycaniphila]|uniref:TetR/AcrR family transcriptional regulator n=1 Tax=Akkermansia glycaniphila TaxID=1679444 RepID=UPI001C02EF53|nr:TetR/AcrR family transcriptional regulator [Akkermansia glycaniphila]MBT9450318.1 TetR/AcrR family transcriptional regulator [Akkermansia glycaniphila]